MSFHQFRAGRPMLQGSLFHAPIIAFLLRRPQPDTGGRTNCLRAPPFVQAVVSGGRLPP